MRTPNLSEPILTHQPCPLCKSSDAAAYYSDGHGFCFSCQGYIDGETAPQERSRQKIKEGLHLDKEITALSKRRLSEETCRKFSYGVIDIKGQKYQAADYYDHSDTLVAQHLRGKDKTFRWAGNGKTEQLQLFGQHLWKSGGKRLCITEGEIDCLSVSQAQGNKWPVVSIPGGVGSAVKAITTNIEWVESFDTVVLCFDMDEPGQDAAHKVASLLTPGKACIAQLPLKDASDMLQAGRSEDIINCLWAARQWRPDGIVTGESLWDEITAPPPKGFTIPWPELHNMTGGLRKKELVLFTAGSGIGKSTVVHELAYDLLMNSQCRIGVMALEESKRRTAERYLSIYLGTPLHISREGVKEEDMRAAFAATIGQKDRFYLYDHFGSSDIDTLMGKIKYLAKACKIDFLVLDHISIVVSGLTDSGEGERKQIDGLMTRLRSLVEETGIGILAVCHLKRPPNGESWNDGKKPRLTDLRGSGALEQLSDTVIAFSRNQEGGGEEGNTIQIEVLKNRYLGVTGQADTLKYEAGTGRLTITKTNPFAQPQEEPQEQPKKTKRTAKKKSSQQGEPSDEEDF